MSVQETASVCANGVAFAFNDIYKAVETFYLRVAADEMLSEPFSSVEDWPVHIDRLTHFWWTRFGGARYRDDSYNPVEKHFKAGFDRSYLSRWLALFRETLEETLSPEQSDTWMALAEQMGSALAFKNEMVKRSMGARPLESAYGNRPMA